MDKKKRSIDGFTSRYHNTGQLDEHTNVPIISKKEPLPPVQPPYNHVSDTQNTSNISITRTDLDASLRALDEDIEEDKHNQKHRKKDKKPKSKLHRIVKWGIILLIVTLLSIGGWMLYRALHATSSIFKGNVLSAVLSSDKPLKADQYGNTNILLLGTSESDPHHPGAQLTDSMMIASINQKTHQVFLLSIPRDLWVTYDHPCSAGFSGKINATYECALGTQLGGLSTQQNDELTAETATAAKIGNVVGADIQYTVHMNLAVIQKVVDAVGGIDITIESPDPRGILDRNFDWRCNYKCYLVKYPNGPAHLSGTDAMWLAQARNDAGGYGLPRSNFDRENNQRKIVMATKDKATSVGFLANPVNVVNLLDALGNNIHTTIDSSEIKSFINVVKDTPSNNITSIDIIENGQNVLTVGVGPDGSSIVRPVAGLESYASLRGFVNQLLNGHAPLIAEKASIDILNGSGTPGVAQQEATMLQSAGFAVATVGDAPKGTYPQYTLYDVSKGAKPKTLAALESQLGVKTALTTLPSGITSKSSFVILMGQTSSQSPSH